MKADRNGFLGAAVLAALFAVPAAAQQVTMMTGPQGGSWIPLGGALKNMWETGGSRAADPAAPGAGIANVRGVDEGKAQIGFANSSTTVDGIEGRPPYPKKVTQVCQVANLYPQYFQVVALADANVNSFADFKGKTLVTQPKGNTAEILTADVLKLNGMSYQSLAQSELPGGVYRRGGHDEGRPRAGVHARDDRAGLCDHGPGQRARRHAGAGRRQDDERAQEDESGLQQSS